MSVPRTRPRATSRTRNTDRAEDGGSPEEARARAWLKAHSTDPLVAGASLPSDHRRDPETGETLSREHAFDQSEDHRALVSYSKWDTVQDWEESRTAKHRRGENADQDYLNTEYTPVVGRGGLTPEQLDKRIRMERAFRSLPEARQHVLRLRFFEQLSVQELADELGIAKASARDRIAVAVQDLYAAIGETWNDHYDLMKEVFGGTTAA
jgi:RNA polymerase sigma factor (sigma-70 family)